jgi:hypothetical protein
MPTTSDQEEQKKKATPSKVLLVVENGSIHGSETSKTLVHQVAPA